MTEKHRNQSSHGAESSDLNIRPIVWFLSTLTVSTAIIFLLMGGLVNVLESQVETAEGKPSPLASERERIAPEPRVQLAPSRIEQIEGKEGPDLKAEHPLVEMKRVREEESEKLRSYGWVDEKNGIVRIPIDEAKKLLLKRGLPIRRRQLQLVPNSAPEARGGASEKTAPEQR